MFMFISKRFPIYIIIFSWLLSCDAILPPSDDSFRSGIISTIAGNGDYGYSFDDIPAQSTMLYGPIDVCIDKYSRLFIADYGNHRIRQIDHNGIITTFAGNGTFGFSGDNGPSNLASLCGPCTIRSDKVGNYYIADCVDNRIRRINNEGIISTIAGDGFYGYSGDNGPAIAARLFGPSDIVFDAQGNLLFADSNNHCIRKIDIMGQITTVIGNGSSGFSGDNGLAPAAMLNTPYSLACDANNNIYIADRGNNRIRKVSNNIITTVAGIGIQGYSGDGGMAIEAKLNSPSGIDCDADGNLYIADTDNNCIRKVQNDGTISTIAGYGCEGFIGDNGPAKQAALNHPRRVKVDFFGNIFIVDTMNHRIRIIWK